MVEDSSVLISVIMPVYNTPAHVLAASLDSILKQDFENYEVICVDDCSHNVETVNTLSNYQQDNNNLHVITLEENSGAANARNAGLSKSRGKYVIFLDADDLFSEELLRKTYNEIIKEKSDICLFEHSVLEEKNGIRHISEATAIDLDNMHSDDEMYILSIPASAWNRLCNKNYLNDNNIEFQNLPSDNDTFFSLMSLLCTRKIAVVKDPSMLLYRFNTDFQISKNMNPLNLMAAINKTKTELAKNNIYNFNKAIDIYTIVTGIMEMRRCKIQENARMFYEEFRKYLRGLDTTFADERINIYLERWLREDFDSKWYELVGDYFRQLKLNTDKLKKVLSDKPVLFIWGHGDRGRAFGQWANEQQISIAGICDKKDVNLYDMDANGIKIVSCEDVKREYGYIVASNKIIYEALSGELAKDSILNLEEYCPL